MIVATVQMKKTAPREIAASRNLDAVTAVAYEDLYGVMENSIVMTGATKWTAIQPVVKASSTVRMLLNV